ncbi:uncharacterized protein [Asterias amurensis]|uniref:uncharacterized protein n=1 Tax=Asterias amurensis TaxID=7602 RepID=UPI003AB41741
MSKRQREKQDGRITGLSRTDHQLGQTKKLRVSSRLRSSRQDASNNDVSSSYTSPGYGSKLLTTGRSPICSTPRSSRKRLNTSRSDSETEIIWDANSPTAHLIKRSGRNGRSKAGEISEMIKCVNNQAETSPAHFPLLGLWTHRSPLHQHELNSAGGSEKPFGEESCTSKKATHKKKKGSRLSLIQDELQKIANAIDMASKHETTSSPNTVLNQEPVTGFITPPRHSRMKELPDTVDDDSSSTNARQELEEKHPQLELTLGDQPQYLQPDPNGVVGNQIKSRQFVSNQQPTSQSADDQTDSKQPLVPCSAVIGQLGTSSAVIGQSLTSNVDLMWDDDSYFEDEALLEQLTQTEAIEASRSQNYDESKKKPSRNNPATHSANSVRQPVNFDATNKMWTENDGEQKSQTFLGTVPPPTITNKSTSAYQNQQCQRLNAMNAVKETRPNQGKKLVPFRQPVAVKPPPAQETRVSNYTIVPSNQHQARPSYKTYNSVPAHLDSTRQPNEYSAKSNVAKPHTSSCPQLGQTVNTMGTNNNSLKPFSTSSNFISYNQLTVPSSMNASSSIQDGWDNMDLFESSLTDEMMMSMCVGIDSPQTTKASEQITNPFTSTGTRVSPKPFMSTRSTTAHAVSVRVSPKPYTSTGTTTAQSQTQNSSKITTNSCVGSSSTTTYKFRKPVKDITQAVSHCSSSASRAKCSTNTSILNQQFQSSINTVRPVQVKNIQPINITRHQPIRVPKTTHQLPQSSGSGVPTQPVVPSSVFNVTKPSSATDNQASSYSKPVNTNSTSYKPLTAQSMRPIQIKTTSSSARNAKPAVLSTSTGSSHKVCSQTEIERKRQQAKARLQQRMTQQR